MRAKAVQVVQILLIVVVVALPSLASAAQNCQCAHAASSNESNENFSMGKASFSGDHTSEKEQLPDSHHSEDCNCPMHRLGCCHSSAYFCSEVVVVILDLSSALDILEPETLLKPGPFLEGPFQPPRA